MTDFLAVGPGVEWVRIEDDVLVFDGGKLHLLAGSAAEIWGAVDGSRTPADVERLISERHPDTSGVSSDVLRFTDDLVQRRLLVRKKAPSGNGFRVPPHVAWTADDGLVVLADLRTGTRRSLSSTASRCWEDTVAGASRESMLVALSTEFPDAPAGFAGEIDRLLDDLVDEGLLERTSPARPVDPGS